LFYIAKIGFVLLWNGKEVLSHLISLDKSENMTSDSIVISCRSSTVSPSHKLSPPVNTKIPGIPGISNIKKSLSFKNITAGQKGNRQYSLHPYAVALPVSGDLENRKVRGP